MDLYFASAEQPQYYDTLLDHGVKRFAISYYEWIRRHDNDRLPRDGVMLITPGISKKASVDFSEYAKGFCEFAELHAERAIIYDIDSIECPAKIRREVRAHLANLPNTVIFPFEDEALEETALQFECIGVNSRIAKSRAPNELRRVAAKLFGSNVLDQKTLKIGRFVATTTMAWLSPKRYGELWVFDGANLKHYSAEGLARACRRHRAQIEAFGVDPGACAANDHDAMVELAIKSMGAMAENLSRRPRDREAPGASLEVGSLRVGEDSSATGGITTPSVALSTMEERERVLLPVISMKEEVEGLRVQSTTTSVRHCDTCDLSGSCPKFSPGEDCAFDFPVEISTRAQWKAASQVLLETQFGRAMFSHFADQTDGGTPSKSTGGEIDRFFRILKDVKELEHIDPPSPQEGAISKALREMEEDDGQSPQTGENDEINEGEGDFIDAELIDDGFADEEAGPRYEDHPQE